jgi:L-glyceraldehyde 3-phosphate reductase
MTSALIGASKVGQIEDCVRSLENLSFSEAELQAIEKILQN